MTQSQVPILSMLLGCLQVTTYICRARPYGQQHKAPVKGLGAGIRYACQTWTLGNLGNSLHHDCVLEHGVVSIFLARVFCVIGDPGRAQL